MSDANDTDTETAKKSSADLVVVIKKTITRNRIANLLVGALDGAYGQSRSWITKIKIHYPRGMTKTDIPKHMEGESRHGNNDDHDGHWSLFDVPLTEGGMVTFEADHEPGILRTLNLDSIQKGLEIMAEKYPHHMNNFLEGNDDADTSDVFLQCCLFTEIVFS